MNDQYEVCDLLGHAETKVGAHTCSVCGQAPTQWVRVEVSEGRAYTYASFEDEPLKRGDRVALPNNVVQSTVFIGTVLRILEGPDASYAGPYKTILRRAS